VRDRVGLMDLSTFAKFEVAGPDALAFLQRICANRVPARDGRIILGHLLNENGVIESELTITRLVQDRFYLLSAAFAQLYDMDQLRWRIASGALCSRRGTGKIDGTKIYGPNCLSAGNKPATAGERRAEGCAGGEAQVGLIRCD
jgi:glycine cleavage system aminomethyltransferase T